MTKYYLSLTFTLIVVYIASAQNLNCRSFQWVPVRRRKVFTTFINNIHCPTWTTRNVVSKDQTKYSKLVLPKGQPFAFNCGACFTPGNFQANLTAEMYPNIPLILKPIPKKHNKNDDLQHIKDGYTVCLISYGITRPIVSGGTLTCNFNAGTKVFKEQISFSVKNPKIEEVGEEENIEFPLNGVVRLQCPPQDESLLIPMHIWYTSDTLEEGQVAFVVPSLDHEIIYRPKKDEKIFCSTYDLTNPTQVRITRYKLILKETENIESGKWVVEEPEEETQPPKQSNNIVIIVAIIIVVGVCLIALILASLGLCKRSRRRNKTEEVEEEETKEQNHLHLISSSSSVSSHNNKGLQHQYWHQ